MISHCFCLHLEELGTYLQKSPHLVGDLMSVLYLFQDALLWTVSSLVPCTEGSQELECFRCNLGMHLLASLTQMKFSLSALSHPCNKNQSPANGNSQNVCFSVLQILAKVLKRTCPFYLLCQLGTIPSVLGSSLTLEWQEILGTPCLLPTSYKKDNSWILSTKLCDPALVFLSFTGPAF